MYLARKILLNPQHMGNEIEILNIWGEDQSRPQSEFVALPLLWETRGRAAI